MSNRGSAFSSQIASSGLAMSTRQVLGTLLSITGTLIVTRIIGPGTYGLFASVTAIQSYVGSFANSGVEVSLLRTHSPEADRRDNQGLLLVLVLSSLCALLCLSLLPLLADWIAAPAIMGPGILVFSALPLTVTWIVPRARLSREMSFVRIAVIELSAQASGVFLALLLAALGAGLWAPTLGWFVQNLVLTTLFFAAARPRLPLAWDGAALRGLLKDSWSFSASSLTWQSKILINPLIVGHFLGAESVGYVALCGRIIEMLSVVRNATWHMLVTSFAKLRGDTERIRSYVSKAAELQVLALAPLLIAFAVLGPLVFPAVMGERWRPVLTLFPFLAAGALATSLVTPTAAALYACGADFPVFWIRLVQVLTVAIVAWVLLPRIGLRGIGYGELTVMATSLLFGLLSKRFIGRARLAVAWLWLLAAVAVIFWQRFGIPVFFAPLAALLFPRSRRALREHLGRVRAQLAQLLASGH